MSDQTERQSLLLPIAMPIGLLVVIALILFGLSRILLAISHTAAVIVALVALVVVVAVASFVASRNQVSGASLFWMVSAIAGTVIAVGGLAVVAAPLGGEETEAQTVTLAAGPTASVDGFSTDALTVGSDIPIEMDFDNQETGLQHNVVVFDGEDDKAPQLFSGSLVTGPGKVAYSIPALPEGSYFFHCEVHPTTMTGEITSKPGAGGEGPPEGGGGQGPIVAQAQAFNTAEIDLTAGQPSTVPFDNQEAGVPHNIAIYTDDTLADVLFQGEIITGPATIDYEVPALDEGEYFFHCDVHPTMQGTVVVAPEPGAGGGGGGDGNGGGGGGGGNGGGDGGDGGGDGGAPPG